MITILTEYVKSQSPALQARDAGVSVKLYQPGTCQETKVAQLVPVGEFSEGACTKVGTKGAGD